jgi:hypothetical protein
MARRWVATASALSSSPRRSLAGALAGSGVELHLVVQRLAFVAQFGDAVLGRLDDGLGLRQGLARDRRRAPPCRGSG